MKRYIENGTIEEIKGWIKDADILKANVAIKYCKENGYKYHFFVGKEMNLVEELSLK